VGEDEPVTIEEVRAAMARVLGADVPIGAPSGPGRYQLRRLVGRNTRLADRYRVGRALVAGDAAHVHSALGGPGLNLGLQDAVNLGWKLAAAVRGWAPDGLVDTYDSERRPVAQRVVLHSQAQSALLAPGAEVTALRTLFGELLGDPAAVRRIAELLAGADVHYDCGDGLSGRWMRDFSMRVVGRRTSLAELSRGGRALLVDLTGDPALADVVAGWADRVELVVGSADAPPADAMLIRPDGYAAWVADADPARRAVSLASALARWFGAPALTGVAGSFPR
jgi:FAD binding domain